MTNTFQGDVSVELDDNGSPIDLAALANKQTDEGQRRLDANAMFQGEVHSSADAPTVAPADVLSSARSLWGTPLSGADVKANSVVNIGGMETTAAVAASLGYLAKDANGNYVMPGQGTTEQTDAELLAEATAEDAPEEAKLPPVQSLSREGEAGLSALTNELPTEMTDALLNDVLGQMESGVGEDGFILSEASSDKYGELLGTDDATMDANLHTVIDSIGNQAARHLQETYSIDDPAAFMEFALSTNRGEFLSAVRTHLFQRTPTNAYTSLVKKYNRHGK